LTNRKEERTIELKGQHSCVRIEYAKSQNSRFKINPSYKLLSFSCRIMIIRKITAVLKD
jgi:hypothetical protein